jgi:hypothetical protein
MMASWLIMMIALPFFGMFVAGFVLIVLAMFKGRDGAAVWGGIIGFLGLLFIASLLLTFLWIEAPGKHVAQEVFDNIDNYQIDAGQLPGNQLPFNNASSGWAGNSGNVKTTWDISLTPLLFLVCGVAALLTLTLRRGFGHAHAGHGRIWPAFIALPVIAFAMFGSVRFHKSQETSSPRVAVSQARAHAERARGFGAQPSKKVAKSQPPYSARTTKQIDEKDIHELMDEFDAPRIVLQAPVAAVSSPAAMIVVTLPATMEIPGALEALANDPDVKLIAKSASAFWSKMKRSSNSSNPFAASQAVAASEAIAEPPPVAPTPPSPPAPAAVQRVSTIEVAESHNSLTNDAGLSSQPAASTGVGKVLRPAWIDEPAIKSGDTQREVIKTEAYATANECYRARDVYLIIKTYEHVRQLQDLPYQDDELPSVSFANGMILADGQPFATGKTNPAWTDSEAIYLRSLGIGIDFMRRELVAKDPNKKNETREYLETVASSVGPMQQLYTQIEFTPAIDREIRQMLDAAKRQDRFKVVGLGAGSVLGMLSMVWGLLKVDTATKGYYTKWLFLGIPAAIILATMFVSTLAWIS